MEHKTQEMETAETLDVVMVVGVADKLLIESAELAETVVYLAGVAAVAQEH